MKIGISGGMAVAALTLALAGCGGRQPLKPVAGQKQPAIPMGASAPPTAQQLMTPPIQSRPERSVELLTQSRTRENDPFDLPPESSPDKPR